MDNKGFEPDCQNNLATDVQQIQNESTGEKKSEPQKCLCDTGAKGTSVDENKNAVGLERQVGLLGCISMIVGTMIGSGIFISPGGLMGRVGSVWLSLFVWIAGAAISLFGALCYIELGTVVPESGAEYSYIFKAFGPRAAFLFSWMSTLVLKPASIAIGCLAFAEYSIQPFLADVQSVFWAVRLICVVTIFVITYINCVSVKFATNVQIVFTIAKLLAFVVIIGGGVYNIFNGKTEHLKFTLEGSVWKFGAIASSFYSCLWSYDGWNQLNLIVEEVKRPYRNLPLAILIGLPLVSVCYVMANVSFLTLMSPEEIVSSDAVAVVYGNRLLGAFSFIIPLSITLSIFGSANGTEFTSARLCFTAAKEGHLPHCLSYIDVKRNTPSLALMFNSFLAILMALALDINGLIDFFSFVAWLFYGAACCSVIILRRSMPDAPRPYRVPLTIAYFMVFLSGYLVLAPIIEDPRIEYLYAIIFLASGLLVYFPFVQFKYVLPGMETLTNWLQLIFQVAPLAMQEQQVVLSEKPVKTNETK